MEINYRQQLGELMKHYNTPKTILELGVAEGWFTKDILKWGFDHLYLIDNWQTIDGQTGDGNYAQDWHDGNYAQVLERTEPFRDKVTIIKGLTQDVEDLVPDNSLGLLFIDACHEKACVKTDLELYYPKVVSGGIVSGHDYLNPAYGVNEAVKEFILANGYQLSDIHQTVEDGDDSNVSFWFIKK